MVAGPIDRRWSRSNSCATGIAAFCAASGLVREASAAATAAARTYVRFVMGIPPEAEGLFQRSELSAAPRWRRGSDSRLTDSPTHRLTDSPTHRLYSKSPL